MAKFAKKKAVKAGRIIKSNPVSLTAGLFNTASQLVNDMQDPYKNKMGSLLGAIGSGAQHWANMSSAYKKDKSAIEQRAKIASIVGNPEMSDDDKFKELISLGDLKTANSLSNRSQFRETLDYKKKHDEKKHKFEKGKYSKDVEWRENVFDKDNEWKEKHFVNDNKWKEKNFENSNFWNKKNLENSNFWNNKNFGFKVGAHQDTLKMHGEDKKAASDTALAHNIATILKGSGNVDQYINFLTNPSKVQGMKSHKGIPVLGFGKRVDEGGLTPLSPTEEKNLKNKLGIK